VLLETPVLTLTILVAILLFPATSVAWTEMVLGPAARFNSQLNVPLSIKPVAPLHVTPAKPERESAIVPVRLVIPWFSTAFSAGDVIATLGGVLSTLRLTVAWAVLPARSLAIPEMI